MCKIECLRGLWRQNALGPASVVVSSIIFAPSTSIKVYGAGGGGKLLLNIECVANHFVE